MKQIPLNFDRDYILLQGEINRLEREKKEEQEKYLRVIKRLGGEVRAKRMYRGRADK